MKRRLHGDKATFRKPYDAINHKYVLSTALEDAEAELRGVLIKRIARQISASINEIGGYRRVQVMICGAEHTLPAPFLRAAASAARPEVPPMSSTIPKPLPSST